MKIKELQVLSFEYLQNKSSAYMLLELVFLQQQMNLDSYVLRKIHPISN